MIIKLQKAINKCEHWTFKVKTWHCCTFYRLVTSDSDDWLRKRTIIVIWGIKWHKTWANTEDIKHKHKEGVLLLKEELRFRNWPLHDGESVVKASGENVPCEELGQTSHGLQKRAQVSESAVQLSTVGLRCDVQPATCSHTHREREVWNHSTTADSSSLATWEQKRH